jgi:signal transduction histidine kinase
MRPAPDANAAPQFGDPRAGRLLALHEVALAISGLTQTQQALELILAQACRLIGTPAGTVYVWDEADAALHCRVARNVPPDLPPKPVRPGEGAAGEAFRSKAAVIVNGYRGWGGASEIGRRERVAAALSVPLRMGERLLGSLTVHTYEPGRAFTEEDAWLLGLLGDQAAKALEQARLVEEAETRARRLLAVHRISTAAAGKADPAATLRLVVRSAVDLLGRSGSAVYLWDEAAGALRLAEHAGLDEYPFDLLLRPGEGLVGHIWLTKAPLVVDDYARWEHAHPEGIRAGNGAVAGFPLLAGGRPHGVLWVRNRGPGPRFTDEDLRILEVLANQAAAAVETARLLEHEARSRALEELARLKSHFVSSVSHELRTPLSYVYGYAELLCVRKQPSSTVKEMAQQIHEAAGRMRRLVDDLLDLGGMDSDNFGLRRRASNVGELVRRAVAEARVRAPGREVRAEVGPLPTAEADPDRLGQVLDNLLENALRYAPDGPIVARARRQGEAIRVEVADRGPGIAAVERPRIFEPFYRGERSETSPVRGGGLGLTIAKRLIERHGGSIGVRSRPGRGSTFWFTLPILAPTPACEQQVHPGPEPSPRGPAHCAATGAWLLRAAAPPQLSTP